MDMMKANVYDKPGHCEVKQVPVPEIGPHQVLITCSRWIPCRVPTVKRT